MKNMKKNELKLKRYQGEKAAVRFFDSGNKEDMSRLRKIVQHREVQERMDSVANMTRKDMFEWADEKGAYGRYYLFAVSGTKEVFGEEAEEVGQVQGFVYLYAGAEERKIIERMVRAKIIKSNLVNNNKIFEISFAKLPEAPGGQISSAVRQSCMELKRLDKIKEGTGVFVFCFIDETNTGSMRVVEACGFERLGKHFYEEDSAEMSALYVLNHKKLMEIMKMKKAGQ